jgi:WD40 repeat protein
VAVGIARGIQLVDVRSETVQRTTGGSTATPSAVLFSPDGETIVSTNLDGTVTLWDVESATPRDTLRGHWNSVQQAAFSPDGKTLYTVSHDGSAIAWDLTRRRGLGRLFTFTHDRTISASGYDGHPGVFSPDGRMLAVGLKGRGVALWNSRTLTPIGTALRHTGGEVKQLAFSPDGRTLAASATDYQQDTTTLWDVGSRSPLHEPLAGRGAVFSPDGTVLATITDSGLQLRETTSWAIRHRIAARNLDDLSFSADGTKIASALGFSGGAHVWDVRTGELIATDPGLPYTADTSVALSSDGSLLAVGGFGGDVRLTDTHTGRLARTLDQAGTGAYSLKFTKDDRMLVVSGFENVASLWDVASGTQIGPRLTAGSRRTDFDISPDGRRLLTTHGNGQGAVWDIDPESWARRACRLANRTLTRKEWEEFLPGRPYEPACTP